MSFFPPTHADDVLCTSFGGEHAQYTRTTSNVEYGFSFEKMAIIDDGGAVGACPHSILQHLLVNPCASIIRFKIRRRLKLTDRNGRKSRRSCHDS
jgi:hypothetical protein